MTKLQGSATDQIVDRLGWHCTVNKEWGKLGEVRDLLKYVLLRLIFTATTNGGKQK